MDVDCTDPFASLNVLDHVLICLILRINPRFCSLYGQGERVNDNKGGTNNLPLHQAHDLVWYTRSCMDNLCIREHGQHACSIRVA